MTKRVRLKDHEATALGFEIRKSKGHGNPKYRLNDKQIKQLTDLRNSGILDASESVGVESKSIKHLWY